MNLLNSGDTLRDRYLIGVRLASGRASATYRAEDLETGRPCVVKELSVGAAIRTAAGSESYDSADFTKLIELFEREARTLAHLEHPGIPSLVEHFSLEADGDTRLYIVQEFIAGDTLERLVESGKHFTEDEARALCRQVAEILTYIHGRSPPLIHRDIKPSNIIVDAAGKAHLVDFGSVRTSAGIGESDGKTIVGTFGYMPLEQYEGRAGPRSDIYALGGTLLYVLTHRAPREIPRRGLRLDFRKYVNVSGDFADILERMVEPDAEARFAGALHVLQALNGRTTVDSGPRRVGLAVPSFGARGRTVTVGLGALLALLLGLAASLFVSAAPDDQGLPPTAPGARTGAGGVAPGPVEPARAADGVLAVDIYRNFRYSDRGWPMGRSVAQTPLGMLSDRPREELTLPEADLSLASSIEYGDLPLGNGADRAIAFILFRDDRGFGLLVDRNNDEDLGNDGPVLRNRGSGDILATEISVEVDVEQPYGTLTQPYQAWLWFTEEGPSRRSGHFYARNHWAGDVMVGRATYAAVAFEEFSHDGLYKDAGLCIDLDRDDTCQDERELFRDGEVVPFPEGSVRLSLLYP
jgi:hypothetical protein